MTPTAAKRGWSTSSSLVGSDNGGCLDNMLHSVLKIKMKWTLSLFTFVLYLVKATWRYISFASYREYIRSWFMIMILITTYGLALWGTQCHTGVGNRKGRNKRGSPEDMYGLSLSNGLYSSPYVCIWSMIISIIHYMPSYNHNQCHHTQPTSLAHPRQATFPPIGTVTTARSTITTWLLWGSSS